MGFNGPIYKLLRQSSYFAANTNSTAGRLTLEITRVSSPYFTSTPSIPLFASPASLSLPLVPPCPRKFRFVSGAARKFEKGEYMYNTNTCTKFTNRSKKMSTLIICYQRLPMFLVIFTVNAFISVCDYFAVNTSMVSVNDQLKHVHSWHADMTTDACAVTVTACLSRIIFLARNL